MYPTAMTKLNIVGPKTKMKEVIKSLYTQNIYHILDHKKTTQLDIGSPCNDSKEISENLVLTRSILSYIKKNDIAPGKFSTKNIDVQLKTLLKEVQTLVDINEESKSKIQTIKKKIEILLALENLGMQAKNIVETNNVEFLIGKVKNININFKSKDIYLKIKDKTVGVIFPKTELDKVISTLNISQFIQYDKNLIIGTLDSNQKAISKAKTKIETLNSLIINNASKLKEIGNKKTAELLGIENYLKEQGEKSDAPLKFANTRDAFIITGFVPTKNIQNVKKKLELASENKIFIKELKINKDDNIPVKMDNQKLAKPFEFLMHMFSLPKVNEIDPTSLMAITFPLFFGFMLGDFGYGLLLLLAFLVMKKFIPQGKPLFNILIISAIGTMFFGVIFGEYFGFEEMPKSVADALDNFGLHIIPHSLTLETSHNLETDALAEIVATDIESSDSLITDESLKPEVAELIYPTPKLIERSHQVPDLLSLSIIIGVAHLFLGFLLGFINIFRNHGLWHAISEKLGWMLLIPALLLLLVKISVITGGIANSINLLLQSTLLVTIIGIIGIILIIIGEGFIGVIELPAILSNTLSYARLMAVGLASVKLAIIINEFATEMFHTGGLAILAGIAILITGHTINILLGVMGPFLHSLRLHYVEFFGKFFKGGGILFKPFGKKE